MEFGAGLLNKFPDLVERGGNDEGDAEVGFLDFFDESNGIILVGEDAMDDAGLVDPLQDGFLIAGKRVAANHVAEVGRVMLGGNLKDFLHLGAGAGLIGELLRGHREEAIVVIQGIDVVFPVDIACTMKHMRHFIFFSSLLQF